MLTDKQRIEKFRKSIRNGSAFKDREEKEYQKVKKMKGEELGNWLEKFSKEGDFWNKEKKPKIKNSDWLGEKSLETHLRESDWL